MKRLKWVRYGVASIAFVGCIANPILTKHTGSYKDKKWIVYVDEFDVIRYEANWNPDIGPFGFNDIPGAIEPSCGCGQNGWVYLNSFGDQKQAIKLVEKKLEDAAKEAS